MSHTTDAQLWADVGLTELWPMVDDFQTLPEEDWQAYVASLARAAYARGYMDALTRAEHPPKLMDWVNELAVRVPV